MSIVASLKSYVIDVTYVKQYGIRMDFHTLAVPAKEDNFTYLNEGLGKKLKILLVEHFHVV